MKFLNFWKSNETFIKYQKLGKEVGQLYVYVEHSRGTSLHNRDVEEFLRIKPPEKGDVGEFLKNKFP